MRILSISRDADIVRSDSAVSARQISYYRGDETDIVILGTGTPTRVELAPGIRAHLAGGAGNVSAFWNALRLARRIRFTNPPDVVTVQDPFWSGVLGWIVARRRPFYLQDHSAAFSRPTNPFARFLARRADRIRTVSERGKRGLLALGVADDRIDVIPIATDVSRFNGVSSPPRGASNVLCVARLEPEKGVDVLLRAWPRVVSRLPSARLRVAGDGSERAGFESLARELRVTESVEFLGQQSDIASQIAWSNVAVQPSHFEGWGLAVIEAAAAGRPVVMTDVGAAGDIIADGTSGIVVPVGDPPALADGIVRVLRDPALAETFSRAARERVAALPSPDVTARNIRASLERAARSPRTARDRVIRAIVIFTFIISAGYAFAYRITPAVDASAYDQVGWNIAQGRGFRLDLTVPVEKDEIITYQGPLYEYVLGGIYTVFGHRLEAVWIVQSALRALTALMLYFICIKIFGEKDRRIGWIAAAFFGFSPDLVEIGSMLMTETLFIFFAVLTAYCFIRAFERITWRDIVLLAVAFSAAILSRSTIILFSFIFLIWFLRRKAFAKMVVFGAICGALLTPWAVRNYVTYKTFIPTMANFGYNFWMGNRVGGNGEGGNTPELHDAIARLGPIPANYYAMNQFTQFVGAHPLAYVELTASRMVKFFSFLRPMGFWFYQTGWKQTVFVACSIIAAFLLFLTSFAGISVALRKEKDIRLAYVAAFGFVMFVSIVPIIFESRYRLPIYPFLAIFSGLFLSRWLGAKKEHARDLAAGLSIACAFAATDIALEWQRIAERVGQLLRRDV